MMKILFLVLLVGIFVVENEALWGRIRLPRVSWPRLPSPRWPRYRHRHPYGNIGKLNDEASNSFEKKYKKICGDPKKSDCGYALVKRVQNVCNGQSCLMRNLNFVKRSIDSSDFNAESVMTNAKLAIKGGAIYRKCCRKACRDSDIVKYCK